MNAQDTVLGELVRNDSAKRHPFEKIVHLLEDTVWIVDILVESLRTFLTEAQVSIDRAILVVASK